MDEDAIISYIAGTFSGVDVQRPTEGPGAGDTFFIYDPQRNLEPRHQIPFATIVTKDYGEFDNASHLDRPGVFRLNVGVSRDTFRTHCPVPDPAAGDPPAYDYAALDRLLPHPVYAAQSWLSVLNPSRATFERVVKPLLVEAYTMATQRGSNVTRDRRGG